MKVPPGYKMLAYEHSQFKGRVKTFIGPVANVGSDFNDRISSFSLQKATGGSGSTCTDGNGACTGACTPGEKECNGLVPRTCDAAGQWQNGSACPYVCMAGTCTGSCVPGCKKCNGTVPKTCDSTGTWQDGQNCGGATPECSAGVCMTGQPSSTGLADTHAVLGLRRPDVLVGTRGSGRPLN